MMLPVNPETTKPWKGVGLLLGALFVFSACSPTSTEPPPDSFVLLADAVKVTPEKDREFEILTRTFGNLGDYKEARIVCWAEPPDKENGANTRDLALVYFAVKQIDEEGKETITSKRIADFLDAGISVPLSGSRTTISLYGKSAMDVPLEISVSANFRRKTILNLDLNEEDLKSFDERYLQLQDNSNDMEDLYEITDDVDQSEENQAVSLFAFDSARELGDLFTPDSRIVIVEGELEETCTVNDFVSSMARGHFSFTLRVETTSGPEVELHPDYAILRAERKMHGQGGIGKPNADLFSWSEEMRIERRDGRLAIASLLRTMHPGSE